MNTFSLLLLCVAIVGVWGAVREKRQQRTVIQRTVINRQPPYGGNTFPALNRGGFGNGWNTNPWGTGFNRGLFGPPQPTQVVRTTVIRQG